MRPPRSPRFGPRRALRLRFQRLDFPGDVRRTDAAEIPHNVVNPVKPLKSPAFKLAMLCLCSLSVPVASAK